jgi:hypothetical protein
LIGSSPVGSFTGLPFFPTRCIPASGSAAAADENPALQLTIKNNEKKVYAMH